MPQPPQYERTIDFTERDGDDTDHPGLNQELDAAAQSINALRTNLALIQRDDGKLQNQSVGADQLAPDAFEAVRADLNNAVTKAEQSSQSALTSALTAQDAVSSAQQSATLAEQARASSQLNAQLAAQSAQEAATAGATAGAAAAQPFAAAAQQAAEDAAESAAAAAAFDPAAYVPKTGGQFTGPVSDPMGNLRDIPQVRTVASGSAILASDMGGHVALAGNCSINLATFENGDVVGILNPGATDVTLTITGNAYISGIDAIRATVTLRKRGMVTVLRSADTLWLSGAVQ